MSLLQNSNAISTDGYNINRSLRFRRSASAYLSRTMSASGTTTTWSVWVKRGQLGVLQSIFDFTDGNTQAFGIQFTASDTLDFYNYSSAYNMRLVTTQVFRDPSAWYHIVCVIDTTQATAADRAKIYVNGTQVSALSTATYPAQNTSMIISTARVFDIGATGAAHTNSFDGYFTEFNFIDGQALTPSSFGETDTTTGVWKPKAYTGTYGTNGFYLPFTDNSALTTTTNVGLGKDFSGNANRWTTNNISITAGATYDSMTDVPTLTSETAANYATLNPLIHDGGIADTYSEANLKVALGDGGNGRLTWSTMSMSSGKWYVEFVFNTVSTSAQYVGVIPITNTVTNRNSGNTNVGANSGEYAYGRVTATYATATTYINGTITNLGTTLAAAGNVIGLAFDATAGTMACYLQNVLQTTITGIPAGEYFFGVSAALTLQSTVNFGQRPFTYTPPTGFKSLNTYNLPDSTIKKGNTVMDATLYTGTGASRSVTNAAGFRPDFVWVKGRSGATDHALYDSVRGTTNDLVSNVSSAATTQAQGLTAFNSNGFTVGTLAKMNTSAATYVGWQWKAGQGSTSWNFNGTLTRTATMTIASPCVVTLTGHGFAAGQAVLFTTTGALPTGVTSGATYYAGNIATNTFNLYDTEANAITGGTTGRVNTSGTQSGSHTCENASKVSVDTTSGFSIVDFVSTAGAGATVGHGLGVAPKMIILKTRAIAADWSTYHESLGNTKYILLNSTAGGVTNSVWWNNTSPTASVFSLGTAFSSGVNWITYCWSEIAGFSKFGSYTGNGSSDGPFVYTGFRPKFVMIKVSSTGSRGNYDGWNINDTSRNLYNLSRPFLQANASSQENSTDNFIDLDILSNGFKIRSGSDGLNGSGVTYIYMAFAENPFKNSLAR